MAILASVTKVSSLVSGLGIWRGSTSMRGSRARGVDAASVAGSESLTTSEALRCMRWNTAAPPFGAAGEPPPLLLPLLLATPLPLPPLALPLPPPLPDDDDEAEVGKEGLGFRI